MNKHILVLGFLAAALAACTSPNGTGASSQADSVVLDVRCAADTDCPSGFQCEDETEHGVTTSVCVSDPEQGTSTGACPAGYEQETEHADTFCKPHGAGGSGADDGGSSGGGADDGAGGSSGGGADDDAGAPASAGGACQTSADCPTGFECEIQIEAGVTTSACKAHGGNG
jgi:Cys-rich repeat protein